MCGIFFGEQKLGEDGTGRGMLIVTTTIRKRFFLLSVNIFQCFLFPSFYSFSFSFMSSPYTILCQEYRYGFKPCDAHKTEILPTICSVNSLVLYRTYPFTLRS